MSAATATRFTVRPSRRIAAGTAPLAQGAYAHLIQQLLEGDLKPGDRLSVMDISAQLQCSRVPVMEALKRLDAEGFVEITPQVGCRVARPNAAEVQDFFELFAAVEGCVTGLAAARRTTADLPAFKTLCRRIDLELKTAGPPAARDPRYRRANLEFHTMIHELARAPLACAVAAGMWDRSDFFIKVAFGSLYFGQHVRQAHLAIRRAMVSGDAQAAQAAISDQLRAVGRLVSARLTALAQRPD